jgi:hypothetical protein
MRNLFHPLLPLAAIFLWTLGCHREVAPAPNETAPTEAAAPTTTATSPEPTPAGPTPSVPDSKEAKTVAATFTPPFPERLELFEPPKRAQSTIRRDDEHGESVELKGFINVDQPRVILSIDGVVSPVPEGGEKYGVHVISIQPPSVVLQRGRNRWTATLE